MISFHPHVKGDAAGNATFIFVFNSRTRTNLKEFQGVPIIVSLRACKPLLLVSGVMVLDCLPVILQNHTQRWNIFSGLPQSV